MFLIIISIKSIKPSFPTTPYIYILVMAALFLSFFPHLISAVADWMSTVHSVALVWI